VLHPHSDRVFALAFGPDGKTLATASHDGTMALSDLRTFEIRKVTPNRGKLWTVVFHPHGRLVATAGDEEVIDLWDVYTGERVYTLPGHTRRVWSVAFHPDGTLMASGSTDGTVRLWRIEENDIVHQATLLGLPAGWAAFTPNGRYKYAGDVKGQFWHVSGMRRFEPGELGDYLPQLRRIEPGTPLAEMAGPDAAAARYQVSQGERQVGGLLHPQISNPRR
jgi:hypothetical protein